MNGEGADAAMEEYAGAFAQRRSPDFSKANLSVWFRCANALIEDGNLDLAIFAVRHMHAAWPNSPWAANVLRMLDLMPPVNSKSIPFGDVFPSPVQVARRPGADIAVVVFCGADDGIGMPLAMLHRWLTQWPVSVIYLRDLKKLSYLGGIEGLGQEIGSAVAGLRTCIETLGARRIICYGASSGGYGALRYGLELGAETVICMAGLVNMRPEFNADLAYLDIARRLHEVFPGQELDVRQLYLRAAQRPKAWLVYGEQNSADRIHAEHMAAAPGAITVQVRGYRSHNPAAHLIRIGAFRAALRRMIGAEEPLSPS